MSRLRVAVDVDGVLVDFVSALADLVERLTGKRPPATCREWDTLKDWGHPISWDTAREHAGWIAANADWYPGAQETLAQLCRDHDVRFATSPMNVDWLRARASWLEAHGFPLRTHQIHITDKSWLADDVVLIDDGVHNLSGPGGHRGPSICIARPWNAHCPPGIPRLDFADVPAYLRG